ncbi:ATP-binding protein [Actinomadura soli]|uniref:ATP-binding protein n=1 Tax=Actinomadura soli TaxID=2508997 RepID=UPI0026BED70D|nr:ATP-binding protein [Actinomadura soli]
MLGQRARPVRRAGTRRPTLETAHGVSSPTQHLELDRRGAEMLFQVLTEREEKNSVAIASNASFSEWGNTFSDPRLCAAIIDRLTFNGTIIETGSESYRLAHSKARQNLASTH